MYSKYKKKKKMRIIEISLVLLIKRSLIYAVLLITANFSC